MSTEKRSAFSRAVRAIVPDPRLNPAQHVSPAVLEYRIQQLEAERDQLAAALDWYTQFCGEHAQWESEQFPPDTAEREWLDNARALLARVKA